jgi:arsenate reductase (glutaredoxin)
MNLIIWHYSGCGTSKKVLDFLRSQNDSLTIREYQKNPPTVSELELLLNKMGISAEDILRKKDNVFKELFSNVTFSNQEWLEAMHQHPSIIERPIVVSDSKAWLARPADEFIANWKI